MDVHSRFLQTPKGVAPFGCIILFQVQEPCHTWLVQLIAGRRQNWQVPCHSWVGLSGTCCNYGTQWIICWQIYKI